MTKKKIDSVLILGSGDVKVGEGGEFDCLTSQAIQALKQANIKTILINPNMATIQTDLGMADVVYFQPLNVHTVQGIIAQEKPAAILLSLGGQTALHLGLALARTLDEFNVMVLGTPLASMQAAEDPSLLCEILEKNGILSSITSEENLTGWKIFEYQILRDHQGNASIVCHMEQMDPLGVHSGDSIFVVPAQTLNHETHQHLCDIALTAAARFNVVGECCIQYAVHPMQSDYRMLGIKVHSSRSSVLASKATGCPIAFIATKLALGEILSELKNNLMTHIAVKIPRWDMDKLKVVDRVIGAEMKSVGEVMAVGKTFPEALQKAVGMLNIGAHDLSDYPHAISNPAQEIALATDRRLFALYAFFKANGSVAEAHQLSGIDPWFLQHIFEIPLLAKTLDSEPLTQERLTQAKQWGFSDVTLGKIYQMSMDEIRQQRKHYHILPCVKKITDTALYFTYHDIEHEVLPMQQAYVIAGSGPYMIGASAELDWCTVNAARAFRKHQHTAIIVNSNLAAVSTDVHESDRLYFESLSVERMLDIAEFEKPVGICLSVGGQIATDLTLPLFHLGLPILGTSPTHIHEVENQEIFSQTLQQFGIDQHTAYIEKAKAFEIDAIADRGQIVMEAISEHIEHADVHAGDATIILPPEKLYLKTIRRAKKIARQLAQALEITGPFNLQLIAKENDLKVVGCHLRASRTFPFVSKVTGYHFVEIMTEVLLGIYQPKPFNTLELDYVAVKTPQFSYLPFTEIDPGARIEMASTGEVTCIAEDLLSAFYLSWQAAGHRILRKKILLSLSDDHKLTLLPQIQALEQQGFTFYATEGTHDFLANHGVGSRCLFKAKDQIEPNVASVLQEGVLDLVINLPSNIQPESRISDGFLIRRLAIDHHLPLITNPKLARLLLNAWIQLPSSLPIKPWQFYLRKHYG